MSEQLSDRRVEDRWSIKKEISLGDLIAIVVALVAVVSAYAKLDSRVTAVEITTALQTTAIQSTLADLRAEMRRVADSFERYKEKREEKTWPK